MAICKHQFIRICDVDKNIGTGTTPRYLTGAQAGCALCGEVREIWPDGNMRVVVKKKDDLNKLTLGKV